ncbi:MAG: hypothetical protein E2598_13030 [Sphingobium sp.]|nr:hypothetical protein [Sphingobium sp.]
MDDEDDGSRDWLPAGTRLAQRVIEQRVIIRVPMMRPGRAVQEERAEEDAPRKVEWEERKGPRCIQLSQLRAATLTTSNGVDMMLRDGTRLRAHFSRECRPEDLYSGFYIRPDKDGSFCGGRDRLLARGGASCLITDFRRLVPQR